MEISGIGSNISFFYPNKENSVKPAEGDVVDIKSQQILSDEEAEKVYNETLSMISNDAFSALTVHSGLSEDRVYALLGA